MYGRFSGPRGSWKGRGWDAEYKIMLHKNGLTVGKILQENGLRETLVEMQSCILLQAMNVAAA